MGELEDEFRPLFVEEAKGHLERIASGLLTLEAAPGDQDAIAGILREVEQERRIVLPAAFTVVVCAARNEVRFERSLAHRAQFAVPIIEERAPRAGAGAGRPR